MIALFSHYINLHSHNNTSQFNRTGYIGKFTYTSLFISIPCRASPSMMVSIKVTIEIMLQGLNTTSEYKNCPDLENISNNSYVPQQDGSII